MASISIGIHLPPSHRWKRFSLQSQSSISLPFHTCYGSSLSRVRTSRLLGKNLLARAEDEAKGSSSASSSSFRQQEGSPNFGKQLEELTSKSGTCDPLCSVDEISSQDFEATYQPKTDLLKAFAIFVAALTGTVAINHSWVAANQDLAMVLLFSIGYAGIIFEESLAFNKSGVGLLMAVGLWVVRSIGAPSTEVAVSELTHATSEVSEIVFFLLGAMTIVEIIDAHQGFKLVTDSITTRNAATSDYSVAAFRAFSTDHIWSLEAPLRDAQWRSLYGLSHPVFTTIVDKLKPHIALSNLSLPSDYAVAMVLSRLSHGLSAKTLAARFSLEPYLVSKITNMVTRLLATKLYAEFIKIPVSRRRLIETTQAFEELTSLPNMCGAIDGTPIKLRRLPPDQSFSTNYHCRFGYSSVLLQVVADNKKIFWDVCVKAPGGSDDASHFRDSLMYHRLTSGDVVWDKVINVRGHHVRPYIVGDWGYPLLSFLLTPFSPNGVGTPAQNLFDGMLMKGRSVVVDAIGLLKARWKILQDLNVGLSHAPQTIVACCVLHNLCQIAKEPEPEPLKDPEETGPAPNILDSEKPLCYYGENVRQALADDLHHRLSSR